MSVLDSTIRVFDLRKGEFSSLPTSAFVLALGNFDGVHTAHRILLLHAARIARMHGYKSAAWCFDPPSSTYLGGVSAQLSTLEEKLSMLAACGLDYAVLADFPSLRERAPADFIEAVLKQQSHAVHVVCGFHYHFGKGGAGDAEMLRQAFGAKGVDILPPICLPIAGCETVISASSVRAQLAIGGVETAARLLGRPYSLIAPVVHGKQLGRTIGIPTINQNVPDGKLVPMDGIYITRVRVDGDAYAGVTNIGHRPTVDGHDAALNCETHILGIDRDLYDKTVTIEFLHRLRGERKFNSIDELKAAVQSDIAAAKQYFNE